MSEKIKVIVADDHKMFLEGITTVLEKNKSVEIIGRANNGKEVLDILANAKPDLILTDLSMPEVNGIELIKEVKKVGDDIKIIALSMHDQGHVISDAVKSGVDGYVLKDSDKEELNKAIEMVMQGNKYYSPLVQDALMKSLTPEKPQSRYDLVVELTEREKEVLELVANDFTQEQIAEKLFISANTVIYHKRKLMSKLNVTTAAGLVRAAMEKGLL